MNKTLLTCALLVSLTAFTASALAGCVDGPAVCVDGPGSKFINGVEVWRECWNYQTTRVCTSEENINFCAGLEATSACSEVANRCVSYGLSGQCLAQEKEFSCSSEVKDTDHIELIDYSHTINSGSDTGQCSSFLDNPECFIAAKKCVEGPETRLINGVAVYKECWKEELSFSCAAQGASNSCQLLSQKGCTPVGEASCVKEGADGCVQYSQKYHCADIPPVEADDISPEGSPQKPGFDLLDCKEATANMSCKTPSFVCLEEDENGDCIKRKYVYDCVKSSEENTCEALEKLPECSVQKSECLERDGVKCIAYKKEIFCQGDQEIEAPDTEILDSSIVIGSIEPSSTCLPLAEHPSCSILRTECVEGPGEKEINGELVYKDCWKYEHVYVCGGASGSSNDCASLEANKECVKVSSECILMSPEGKCLTTAHTYRCTEKEGHVVEEVICRPAECPGGVCGAPDPSDTEFSKVIAILEAARQGAVYGDLDNGMFFGGKKDECSKKVLGFSCCDTKVKAGNSNSSAFGKAMSFAGDATVETIKYVGSPYVYDVLSASDATSGLLNMLYGDATSGIYNPSLSFYGFGMTLEGGTMYFTFDPTSFALSVAAQIALDYFQCEPSEQALMLKKGQNLCHYVGTYCSKGEAFGCIERKESYCCFNSPLARIIQEQGRLQLARGWGSAKNPMCQGFTQEELESLDFDAMDLSEFEALIVQKSELNIEAAQDRGETHVNNLVDKDLGAYVSPAAGASHVVDPNFTGKPVFKPAAKKPQKRSS